MNTLGLDVKVYVCLFVFLEAGTLAFQILNFQRVQGCYFLRQKPKHANTYLSLYKGTHSD